MPEKAAKEIVVHTAGGKYEAAQIAVRPRDDSVGGLRGIRPGVAEIMRGLSGHFYVE